MPTPTEFDQLESAYTASQFPLSLESRVAHVHQRRSWLGPITATAILAGLGLSLAGYTGLGTRSAHATDLSKAEKAEQAVYEQTFHELYPGIEKSGLLKDQGIRKVTRYATEEILKVCPDFLKTLKDTRAGHLVREPNPGEFRANLHLPMLIVSNYTRDQTQLGFQIAMKKEENGAVIEDTHPSEMHFTVGAVPVVIMPNYVRDVKAEATEILRRAADPTEFNFLQAPENTYLLIGTFPSPVDKKEGKPACLPTEVVFKDMYDHTVIGDKAELIFPSLISPALIQKAKKGGLKLSEPYDLVLRAPYEEAVGCGWNHYLSQSIH